MHLCLRLFLLDMAVKGGITCDDDEDDDDDVILLNTSAESVAGRMVSTPVQGHPATIDISDVISSIHGNLS